MTFSALCNVQNLNIGGFAIVSFGEFLPRDKPHKRIQKKRKHWAKKTGIVTFDSASQTYHCLECDERHEQKCEWHPKEIARHLEQAHNIPREYKTWRMKSIPNWNELFERDYIDNLDKENEKKVAIETRKAKEIENEEKKQEQQEQQTERDGY
ncbi:MAG TPA: hypothetical protein VMT42_07510 [candidate division Zixibacteria bacterium]|nr:hypothetical protein [candidate division Zixibacteria bacterium]